MTLEGITRLSLAEEKIKTVKATNEVLKLEKELEEEKACTERLKIAQERTEKTSELLEKYPYILKLQRYGEYLDKEAQSMGKGVKKLNIVDQNGEESDGHKAERDFLNDVFIKKDQRVLVLKDKSPDLKREVFNDLIEYYSDSGFQKKEECKLGKFSKGVLQGYFDENNLGVEDISFMTGVGTPIDFNFGVDSWVEIKGADGKVEKIFFDLKTGGANSRKSEFADLLFNIEESNGVVNLENQRTSNQIISFLKRVTLEYYNKKITKIK